MTLGLLPGLDVLIRDCGWFEIPGLTVLLELVGVCTDRDWLGGLTTLGAVEETLGIRLIGAGFVRPMDGELVGARLMPGDALAEGRLMLGGALTLGEGAGVGAGLETDRLADELPPPELGLFRSGLSPRTGS